MQKCPNSRLAIKTIGFIEEEEKKRILERIEKYNININQINILNWSESHRDHLKTYNKVDVCLDPFPYGGATSTCESIIMGVPVITLSGKGMIGQLAASVLRYSGMENHIKLNSNEYIKHAIEYARNGIRDESQRKNIRTKVRNSELCQATRYIESLEEQLVRIIRHYDVI